MSRQVAGHKVDIPFLTHDPGGGDAGADLSVLTDKTASFAQTKSGKHCLRLVLTGGTSVELVLWVKDDIGWGRLGDTGNLGLLGGQAIPPGAYRFQIEDIGIFDQLLIRAQNNTGGVALTSANLIEYRDDQTKA